MINSQGENVQSRYKGILNEQQGELLARRFNPAYEGKKDEKTGKWVYQPHPDQYYFDVLTGKSGGENGFYDVPKIVEFMVSAEIYAMFKARDKINVRFLITAGERGSFMFKPIGVEYEGKVYMIEAEKAKEIENIVIDKEEE